MNDLLDIKSLQVFLEVCEQHNMTRAASALHLTQSAVSHHIAQLEKQLGVQLLDREVRPLALTNAGKTLQQHAMKHVSGIQHTMGVLKKGSRNAFVNLNLGMCPSFAVGCLPEIVTQLNQMVDHLRIETNNSLTLTEKLLNRELDMIVASDSILDTGLIVKETICRQKLLGISNPQLTQSLSDPLSFDALVKSNSLYVSYPVELSIGRIMKRFFTYRNVDHHDNDMQVNSVRNAFVLTRSMPVWSITSPFFVAQLPTHFLDKVDFFELPAPAPKSAFYLYYRENEFGDLSSEILDVTRQIVSDVCFNKVVENLPEFKELICVPS